MEIKNKFEVKRAINKSTRSKFVGHLLDDIKALELMLKRGMFESDVTRIGAEQEFCLVNEQWRPSNKAEDILKSIDDSHFTTELAQYNLEINLDPIKFKKDCFLVLENQLKGYLHKAQVAAEKHNSKVVLTGILPTISKNELAFDFMTPNPRYWALNDMIKEIRGSDIELHLRGVDELSITHDSVLFEACNTSFQMHLQVSPEDFISSYNWSQMIAGPVLAMSTNSPLLLGRELWSETRIALFQQSIDTRNYSYALKDQLARVTFGDAWATDSIVELFKNEIARFKIILAKEIKESSLDQLEKGVSPDLQALNLHNGTIYRWNRPCFGVKNGIGHLRIENRYIPSGPTVIDEMANFAFWVGLMKGRPTDFDDIENKLDFRDAKSNFIKAARNGKESVMAWGGKNVPAKKLVQNELLVIAQDGLEKFGIDKKDINRLLGVIEKRAAGMTGSQWKIKNYRTLRQSKKQNDALLDLTKAIYQNQASELPVSQWPILESNNESSPKAELVSHIMTTHLYTVNENDPAKLATQVMQWKNIHHMPVENNSGKLSGLLTWTHMEHFKGKEKQDQTLTVSDIMEPCVLTAIPEMKIEAAIKLMEKQRIGCLPVVQKDQLVGIISINDLKTFNHGESI
ncbi:MAG: CBS domain-containing protein [Reichenbachiella sp.]